VIEQKENELSRITEALNQKKSENLELKKQLAKGGVTQGYPTTDDLEEVVKSRDTYRTELEKLQRRHNELLKNKINWWKQNI